MSQDDNFKRASLRGRGWKILRGVDQPTDEFLNGETPPPEPTSLTSDEIDDLLSVEPPPIGITSSPLMASDMDWQPLEATPLENKADVRESQTTFPAVLTSPSDLAPDEDTGEWDVKAESAAVEATTAQSEPEGAYSHIWESTSDEQLLDDFGLEFPEIPAPADEPPLEIPLSKIDLAALEGRLDSAEFPDFAPSTASGDAAIQESPYVSPNVEWAIQELDGRAEDTRPLHFDSGLDFPDLSSLANEGGTSSVAESDVHGAGEPPLVPAIPTPSIPDASPETWQPAELDQMSEKLYETLEPPNNLPIIDSPDEEALPIPEPSHSVLDPISLQGKQRLVNLSVSSLIPHIPETAIAESNFDEAALQVIAPTVSELNVAPQLSEAAGAVLYEEDIPSEEYEEIEPAVQVEVIKPDGVEGIPLVEDIDRPQAINLKGLTRRTPSKDLIPKKPEMAGNGRAVDIVIDSTRGTGGILVTPANVSDDDLPSPFDVPVDRPRAQKLFPKTRDADPQLLEHFVDDYRLEELWNLIEQLQEDVADHVSADRRRTDTYQQELLRASDLLLQSRENYDDARAIAYRIRADLKRDRRVDQDIKRFRPLIFNYIIGWAIGLVVLWWLKGAVVGVAERLDVPFVGAAYLPSLLGACGGLFLAYSTFQKHTAIRRDFDPIHAPWYLLTPFVGALMGFLAYLFWLATILDTATISSTEDAPILVILSAFAAGVWQNRIIKLLRSIRGVFGDDSENSVQKSDS